MTLLILILLLVCIGMPLGYAWRIWRLDEATRAGWLAIVAEAAVIVFFVIMVGRWDIAGYYTRFALLAVLAAAIFRSWRRHAGRPWRAPDGPALLHSHWSTLLSLVLFAAGVAYAAAGHRVGPDARPLEFPLEDGHFMATQGGGNLLLNHHYGHRAQRHAVDIVAVDATGFRATGLHPDDPARYVAYGAAVVSPCDGRVAKTHDGLPDLDPPESDPENPAGNHVVVACDGMLVELAHLRNGSIEVESGDILAAGERIAAAGNSGNTTEPHLHIHAVDAVGGEGVQIVFDGVAPARNTTFRR